MRSCSASSSPTTTLGGAGPRLVLGVEEEVRPVPGHDDRTGEPLACFVVEIERPDPLAQRHPFRFFFELDLDAPLVRFHEAK